MALARLRWRPQDADAVQLRGFAARYPHLPVWEAMLASLEWELGNVEAARRGVALCARDDFAAIVRSPDFLPAAVCLAEAAAGAGEPWHVERLYALLFALRRRQPGARAPVGGLGAGGARARAARRGRRPSAATPPPTSPRRCGSPTRGDRPAGRCGRSATGSRPASRRPDRNELVNRGLSLAGELGLPGVAARIVDEAHTITP